MASERDAGANERRPEVVAVAVVAVEVARRLAAGHALPKMSSVLLRHQAVPELVPVVEVSMVPLRIGPEVSLLRDGETPI